MISDNIKWSRLRKRIIVTLTTIPPRFIRLHYTLESLFCQTVQPDMIVINVPEKYNNYSNDILFPKVEKEYVIVNRCKDYGPATKLLGLYGTKIYNDMCDDDIIIVVDDDRNYNNKMIEGMLNYHRQYPNAALTIAGWDIEALTRNKIQYEKTKMPRGMSDFKSFGYVDILGGCCGFLLTKSGCPFNHSMIFALKPNDPKYYVDDVWLSGFLTLNGVDIYIIPNVTTRDEPPTVNNYICPLANETREPKNIACIEYFRKNYGIWK